MRVVSQVHEKQTLTCNESITVLCSLTLISCICLVCGLFVRVSFQYMYSILHCMVNYILHLEDKKWHNIQVKTKRSKIGMSTESFGSVTTVCDTTSFCCCLLADHEFSPPLSTCNMPRKDTSFTTKLP